MMKYKIQSNDNINVAHWEDNHESSASTTTWTRSSLRLTQGPEDKILAKPPYCACGDSKVVRIDNSKKRLA